MAERIPTPTPYPSRGALAFLDEKRRAREEALSLATMAVAADRDESDPSGQGKNQRLPAPTTTEVQPKVGTGPAAAAERPARPAVAGQPRSYYDGVKATKTPDGRIRFTDPEEALASSRAGSSFMDYGQAVMEAGDPRGSTLDTTGVVKGSAGTAFVQPGKSARVGEGPVASKPYSAKVRELANQDLPDLAEPGSDWSFTGGVGTGKAREGTRKLSGLEQRLSRRQWLEGRADAEAGREEDLAKQDLDVARTEQLTRQAKLPPPDPLELARIEAEGRYGDARIKAATDLETRKASSSLYARYSQAINDARLELAALDPASPEAAQIKQYMDALIRERMEQANIIGGHALRDPRSDPFAGILGLIPASRPGEQQ